MNNILKGAILFGGMSVSYLLGAFYRRHSSKPKSAEVISEKDAKVITDTVNQINEVLAGLKTDR